MLFGRCYGAEVTFRLHVCAVLLGSPYFRGLQETYLIWATGVTELELTELRDLKKVVGKSEAMLITARKTRGDSELVP